MKLLTLTQPWAQLVALGAKRIETRGKQTHYRGELAIHAAKGLDGIFKGADVLDLAEACRQPFIYEALATGGFAAGNLPRGHVVALARLVRCTRMTPATIDQLAPFDSPERAFGHYAPGRWAWALEDVRPLARPYKLRGQQWLADVAADDAALITRLALEGAAATTNARTA